MSANPLPDLPLPGERVADYCERLLVLPHDHVVRAYSRKHVRTALEKGAISRPLPGVLSSSRHAHSFAVRAQAATMWADAPVTGLAALFMWGLVPEPPAEIDVVVAHERRPRHRDGYRVRRTTRKIVERRVNGTRVVSVAEAIVAGLHAVAASNRAEVLYRAVRDRLVNVQQLEAALVAAPRVRNRRALKRRVDAALAGARSFLEETGLQKVFTGKRFEGFTRQHEVMVEGELFVLDMYHHQTRTCVELDGAAHHAGTEQWQRALRRDAILASVGIQTVRFSYADITERPAWCRQQLSEVLERRR